MNAKKAFVSNKDETIRLFKNDALEAMTKVHPATPLVIFVPVVCYHLYFSQNTGIGFLYGISFWTLFEYLLHRYVFHWKPQNRIGQRLHFLFHGIHHDYPKDSQRLVMPPLVAIVLSSLLYLIFNVTLPSELLHSFFAGFMFGYLCYDMTHFAIHHFNLKNKWFLMVKKNHLQHHYDDDSQNYGVSSPLWDIVFNTKYKK